MYWSFSEYLNLVELRSQTWCVVDVSASGGFRIPHSDTVFFYAVLDGSVRISGVADETLILESGEIAIVLPDRAHAIRSRPDNSVPVLSFLFSGEYVDSPIGIALGTGSLEARLLCGRLRARWPGGKLPHGLPAVLRTSSQGAHVNVAEFVESAKDSGGSALLTRLAVLIFIDAFRSHPASHAIFRESGLREPIARALQFIQTHPFIGWTVMRLATKVGMGRSNFASQFLAETGVTPMAMVTEVKMMHAAALLEQSDLKVGEIAERVGYRSESGFSHRFVTHFGMTPSEMRKRKRAALQRPDRPGREVPADGIVPANSA